jgi:hypothetical protein
MAYFPFDRRRIFERASSTPLPEWAAEFDAKTWAQFFLKYVLSHPAVTVARTGRPRRSTCSTTSAEASAPAGRGDCASGWRSSWTRSRRHRPPSRRRQPRHPKNLAVALSAAVLDRYVGEYKYAAVGTIVTVRRDGDRLFVKSGNMPEGPSSRARRRASRPPGEPPSSFQLDGQGKVTGAIVEQGPYRIPLERT